MMVFPILCSDGGFLLVDSVQHFAVRSTRCDPCGCGELFLLLRLESIAFTVTAVHQFFTYGFSCGTPVISASGRSCGICGCCA